MLYTFRSKAGADVLMLSAQAEALLRALGREVAPEGIFTADQIPAALAQLDEAEGREVRPIEGDAEDPAEHPEPGLRQRAWPLRELLQRAAAKACSVSWQVA